MDSFVRRADKGLVTTLQPRSTVRELSPDQAHIVWQAYSRLDTISDSRSSWAGFGSNICKVV